MEKNSKQLAELRVEQLAVRTQQCAAILIDYSVYLPLHIDTL